MEILVSIKQVYGSTMVYPECDKAKLLAKLTGTKTLTPAHLAIIRELGYSVAVKPQQTRSIKLNPPRRLLKWNA